VGLYTDSATGPGSLLETLGTIPDSHLNTTLAVLDFSLSSPEALAANTRYWIGVSATNSSAEWSFDATNGGTGVANEYNDYDSSVS